MMINLAFKFFKKFNKRTSQGIKIVTFSIAILLITQIFLTTLNQQVTYIANSNDSSTTVVKYDKITQNNYSENDIEEILNIIDLYKSNIEDYYFETECFSEVYAMIDGESHNISTHFVDDNFKGLKIENQNEIMMTKDLDGIYQIGEQIKIKLNNTIEKKFTVVGIVNTNSKIISSGFYIPNYLANFTNYNTLNIELSSDMVEMLNNEINNKIENLNFEIISSEEDYILEVYHEFELIINLLTIFMFIMTLLGIINVTRVIILESKPEITILKSVGYNAFSIKLIFSTITSMMIIIGALLAIPIAISISNISLNILGPTIYGLNNMVAVEFSVLIRLVIFFVTLGTLITYIITRDYIDRA